MRVDEVTRSDVERRLASMGDYVRIDYLSSCLKNKLDFDTRRFVLIKLANLYEDKKMFSEAARMIKSAADINTNENNKVDDLMLSAELAIKGKMFGEAEITIKKALSFCSERRKKEIKNNVKEMYKRVAREYEQKDHRKQAADVYNILLEFDLDKDERGEVYSKLLSLNESLGRVKDYYQIKKLMEKQ